MRKNYIVRGFGRVMDVTFECDDAKRVSDLFDLLMNGGEYNEGYVMDSHTGEVFCHFSHQVENDGIKITYWTAFA